MCQVTHRSVLVGVWTDLLMLGWNHNRLHILHAFETAAGRCCVFKDVRDIFREEEQHLRLDTSIVAFSVNFSP